MSNSKMMLDYLKDTDRKSNDSVESMKDMLKAGIFGAVAITAFILIIELRIFIDPLL